MEYRSNARLFGLPLLHIASGTSVDGAYRRGVATGWVAIGDIAIGVLFACGGLALGGISVGGAALGLLSLGGLALGLLAIGGLGLGAVAVGGAAFAWYAAIGGLAVAYDTAIGGAAFGHHVVSPLSPTFMSTHPLRRAPFRWSDAALLIVLVWALLAVARTIQERRRENRSPNPHG